MDRTLQIITEKAVAKRDFTTELSVVYLHVKFSRKTNTANLNVHYITFKSEVL